MRALLIGGLVALASAPATAWACQFSTDCHVGSKCMKEPGRLQGVCVGGISPGRPADQPPPRDIMRDIQDLNRTKGEQCSFNTDCGPGSMCLKRSGSIYGVCLPKR